MLLLLFPSEVPLEMKAHNLPNTSCCDLNENYSLSVRILYTHLSSTISHVPTQYHHNVNEAPG